MIKEFTDAVLNELAFVNWKTVFLGVVGGLWFIAMLYVAIVSVMVL